MKTAKSQNKSVIINLQDLVREMDEACNQAMHSAYVFMDGRTIEASVARLKPVARRLREAKLALMRGKHEHDANMFLGFQMVAEALLDELAMYRQLRLSRPHEAWVALVSAQQKMALCLRTPAGNEVTHPYFERLQTIERAFFPRLTFVSAGIVRGCGKCSICGLPFGDCHHLEWQIYCGAVCAEVGCAGFEADHIAIVEQPRDKRCYIRSFQRKDGKYVDVMTRKVVASKIGKDVSTLEGGTMKADAVILYAGSPPGVQP